MILKTQQSAAMSAIRAFLSGETSVFILRGYAGTGKTTIVRPVMDLAASLGRQCVLMAPTGRAAKVLAEKTGAAAATIHSTIYSLHAVLADEGSESEESRLQYRFPLAKMEKRPGHEGALSPERSVLIVDEASMVSSRKTTGDLFQFGTGVLLDDIIEYAGLSSGGKIIFIGDPAQLPPVGDPDSMALDPMFFKARGIKTDMYELTEIVRQDSDSAVLDNSIMVRSLIGSECRPSLVLSRKAGEVEDISVEGIITRYCEIAPRPSLDSPAIICFSNRSAAAYNNAIRDTYFPGRVDEVQPGDKLIVVGNNYSYGARKVYNGEYAIVTAVLSGVEMQTGVIYVKKSDGTKERKTLDLSFRDLELAFDDGVVIRTKVFDGLIGSSNPNLTYHEQCALMSNFGMRHEELKKGSEAYVQAMLADPYYNAIRVKYGYATTCHKAQGGEWDTVFVDFSGRIGLNRDCLRWSYTAITRSSRRLYGHLLHNVPAMKARVMDVVKVSSMPEEYYPSSDVPCGPFSTKGEPAAVRARYWQVAESMEGSEYHISGIEHKPYREIYTVEDCDGARFRFDGTYNRAGHLGALKPADLSSTPEELVEMMNPTAPLALRLEYVPSAPSLEELYSKVSSLCDENGITITNIVEHLGNYKVVYYLRTGAGFAYLDICVNKHGQVTYIAPRSEVGEKDSALAALVESLKQ